MKFDWSDWQYYAIMLFAVVSGQVARIGYKLENGGKVGRGQLLIEMTMLPGFASLGGAFAADKNLSIIWVLAIGLAAGWLGFALFKLGGEIVLNAIKARYQGGSSQQG